jgi:DNA invertase Pin-like site-specific DNA recombinase
MVDDLDRCCVGLILLSMGCQRIDTRAPTSKLMIALLGAIAEFERGLLLERQREGVGRQRQTGMYKGRKPMVRAKATKVIKLSAERLQGAESCGVPRLARHVEIRCGVGLSSAGRRQEEARKPEVGVIC